MSIKEKNIIQQNVILLLKDKSINLDIEYYEKLIEYLKKNSISLIGLYEKSKKNHTFFSSDIFSKYLKQEKEILHKWKKDFEPIKNAWEKEDIEYIFHKSIGEMPYLSGNLDILVKQKDFEKAGRILESLDYIDLRNIQEAHKKYYRKFDGNIEILPIHLHERVCWIVPFEDNEHIWKYYKINRKNPIIHYPSYDDAVIIILAHHFLEDHNISLFDLLTLKECIDNGNIDWEFVIRTATKLKWEHSIYTALIMFNHFYLKLFGEQIGIPRNTLKRAFGYVNRRPWISAYLYKNLLKNDIPMPFKISHLWTRIHTALRELRDPTFGSIKDRFVQVFGGFLDRFIQLKLKLATHPSMLITFSGVDGSGKSSHIKNLRFTFEKCGIPSKYLWNRIGSMPLSKLILKSYRYIKFGKTEKSEIISEIGKSNYIEKSKTNILLWKIISILDIITYYFFKIYIPLKFGKVIIVDRFLLDNIVDLAISTNEKKPDILLYKILKKITPKPDIEYYIQTSLPLIKQRINDENFQDIKIKTNIYETLLKYNKDIIIINNDSSLKDVSNNIHRRALKMFFDKYPDKYKGYKVISWRYK